jgi:hypothetical protein
MKVSSYSGQPSSKVSTTIAVQFLEVLWSAREQPSIYSGNLDEFIVRKYLSCKPADAFEKKISVMCFRAKIVAKAVGRK